MKWLLACACLIILTPTVHAETDRQTQALATSQSALGRTLPNIHFTGSKGQPFSMKDFHGKPLLVTLVYTACADVCPALIESLHPAVKQAQSALGKDSFSVITVGFDAGKDTPERMRTFASSRGIRLPNWQFLSADEADIDALAQSVGFGIYARAGGYDHLAQISIIDASGKVYRQVYGSAFDPPLIVEPLKDLVLGRYKPLESFQGFFDRIKLFCTTYDPNSGRYYFNYSFFIGMAIGIGSLSLVLLFLVREWRHTVAHNQEHG